MKTPVRRIAPWLAAAVAGATLVLAPVASAATQPAPKSNATAPAAGTGTDPSVPYGTNPESPYIFGYHNWPGDDEDVPF